MLKSLRTPSIVVASFLLISVFASNVPAIALRDANVIFTCTSPLSGHVSVLKTATAKCIPGQYVEEWSRTLAESSMSTDSATRTITICTPKDRSQNYALVQVRCTRSQNSQTFVRNFAVPEVPVIQTVSAIDEDSARISIKNIASLGDFTNIRYRFVNVETGLAVKATKEREGIYRIRNLLANTAYQFIVYAENIDGISKGSALSESVKTLAKPIRVVTYVSQNNNSSGPRTYQLGDTGPGGGKIFYIDLNGFNCGIGHTNTGSPTGALCNYLEVAPSTWSSESTDPLRPWALSAGNLDSAPVPNLNLNDGDFSDSTRIGSGYFNSLAIVAQGNDLGSSAGLARSYRGGGLSDWYLGHIVEMSLLCQWAVGQSPSTSQTCSGSSFVNDGFEQDDVYASSSQAADWAQIYQSFILTGPASLEIDGTWKSNQYHVRPIRAF